MLTSYYKRTVAEHRQVYKNEVQNVFKQIHKDYTHFWIFIQIIWVQPQFDRNLRENIAEEGSF